VLKDEGAGGRCGLCRAPLLPGGLHLPPGRVCPRMKLAPRTKRGVTWVYWIFPAGKLPFPDRDAFAHCTLEDLMALGRGQLAPGIGLSLLAGAFSRAVWRGDLPEWSSALDDAFGPSWRADPKPALTEPASLVSACEALVAVQDRRV
jgi:hypothetical protein